MSLPSSDRDGKPMVGLGFLVALGVVFIGVVMSLHPDLLGFRSWRYASGTDPVALAYLRLELGRAPDNRGLRRALTRQLLGAGRLDEAGEVVAPLLEAPVDGVDFGLGLEVGLARVRASVAAERAEQARAVRERLEAGLSLSLGPAVIREGERAAHELGRPGLAARYVDRREDLPRRARLERAARLYTEAGARDLARDRWRALAGELDARDAPKRRARVAKALIELGDRSAARAVLRGWLKRDPASLEALGLAIEVARADGELDEAFALSARRTAIAPQDPRVLAEHLDLALARARPRDGLEAARALGRLRSGDSGAQARWARVAEWSGRPEEALKVWWRQARAGDPAALAEAERLASVVRDWAVALDIARMRLETGPPDDPALVDRVVELAEALGRPEEARSVLLEAIERPSAPRRWWTALARLETWMGLPSAADETWASLARRSTLTVEERRAWAELRWRAQGPRAALELLATGEPAPDLDALIVELGLQVGERERTKSALRRMRERGDLSAGQILSAIRLFSVEGEPDEALAFAEDGLRAHARVDILYAGMEAALRFDRPRAAVRLEALSEETVSRARSQARFWRLEARLAAALGRSGRAAVAYARVVELDPGATQAKVDLLWHLIDGDDAASLRRWLPRLERGARPGRRRDGSPGLWPALAAGRTRLGHHRRAAEWFALLAERKPSDWRFWLDYALNLERRGRRDAGGRLRRWALGSSLGASPSARLFLGEGVLSRPARLSAARGVLVDAGAPPGDRSSAQAFLHTILPRGLVGLPRLEEDDPVLLLEQAIDEPDLGRVQALLERDALPEALRARGLSLLGRSGAALAAVGRARVAGELEARTAREYLARHTARVRTQAHGAARYRQLGRLAAVGAVAEAEGAAEDLILGASAFVDRYDDAPGRAVGLERSGAAGLLLGVERWWRTGFVALRAGVHGQTASALPVVELLAEDRLLPGWRLGLGLATGSVVPETPLQETLAARDTVSARLSGQLDDRLGTSLFASLEHHVDRGRRTLGFGATLEGAVSWSAFRTRFGDEGALYGSARTVLRQVEDELPAELRALTEAGSSPSDLVPTDVSAVGVGFRLARGSLDTVPDPRVALRYHLDVWLGGQWPLGQVAYQMGAGLGLRLMGPDELYVRGNLGNLVGGLDAVQADLQLGYRIRFDP